MKRPIPFCLLILILAAALCFSACAENKTPGDVFMPIDESDAYPSETVRADFSTEAPKDYTLPVDETTAAPDSDAALDVLNHYSNMFIASKVNNYLNIRNAPSTEGAIGFSCRLSGCRKSSPAMKRVPLPPPSRSKWSTLSRNA